MDVGLALQNVLVGLAVLGSLLYVLLTRFPSTARRMRSTIAIRLIGSALPPVVRLGRSLAPAPRTGVRCGGCDSCD